MVFGEVLTGKSIARKIENLPTEEGDKPSKDVVITDCGELSPDEIAAGQQKTADATGDEYEDFPEDVNKELSAGEIVKIAGDLKGYGNKAFQELKNLDLGLEKYQKGIRYLNEDPNMEKETPETKKQLDSLRYSLNSNSALLSNKLKDFTEAKRFATSALEVSGLTNVEQCKALFRRAIAEIGLKDEEAALKDLNEANKLNPGDGAVVQELANVKKAAAEQARKEKAAYKKFFV